MFYTGGRVRWLAAVLAVGVLGGGAARADDDDTAALVAAYNTAKALREKGRLQEAASFYEKALDLAPKAFGEGHENTAAILNNLAGLYQDMGQYERAEPLYQRSLRIYQDKVGKDDPNVATILGRLAGLYYQMGQYAKAEPLYQRSLQIDEDKLGKDDPEVARSLNNLGLLYCHMGQYDKAEPLYRRSLQIWEAKLGKDHPDVATSLNNLAELYRDMDQYDKAEPLYLRSLRISEDKLGTDDPAVAVSLNNLALLYVAMGQYARAEPLYQRSLKILEDKLGKDHSDVGASLVNLASLYTDLGQYAKAEPLYQRSLQIFEEKLGKDHPRVALSLNAAAGLYMDMGQYDKAEALYQRSLKISEEKLGKNHPLVATTLSNLAILCRDRGDSAQAEQLLQRSLQISEEKLGKDHPDVAKCLHNLAGLDAVLGRWKEGAEAADRARRIIRRHVASVLPGLSEKEQLVFLQNTALVDFSVAQSFALARRDDADTAALSAGWVLNGKGVAQEALAQRALAALEAKDPATAELSRQLYDVRRQFAALSLAAAQPGQEDPRRKLLNDLAAQEHDLSRRLDQAGGRTRRTEPWVELADVRKVLPADAVLMEVSRFMVFDIGTKDKDKKAQHVHYAAWVIPSAGQGEVRLIDLGDAGPIDGAVQAVRQALKEAQGLPGRPNTSTIAQDGEPDAEKALLKPLQDLSKLVLEPLAEHIDGKKRWYVSPDASLWLVPWAALPLKDGRYAVEGHTISYLISGRDLVAPRSELKPGRPRMMADPDYDLGVAEARAATNKLIGQPEESDPGLALRGLAPSLGRLAAPRLPGTAAEALAIKPSLEKYAGEEAWLYQREKALEGVFKTFRGPRVLVLSTHGFFLPDQEVAPADKIGLEEKRPALDKDNKPLENPLLRCGLLLAGCNNRDQAQEGDEDGILTGLEVVGTDLRGTELVVLSACETGLGDVHNGEGVAGLRQAFQLAGARSVAATLWQVPDRESAKLMSDFFGNLADTKDKAEALRQAQLAMIRQRRDKNAAAHPFFWAAFTLTGQ